MNVQVAGVGVHSFGRFPHLTLRDLARTAALRALEDAAMGPKDVEAVYSSNSLGGALFGQHQIRGQTVVRDFGISGIPVVNVENACAGGSTAFREAVLAVKSGEVRVALALGFEKMFVEDRGKTLSALESAGDLDVIGGVGLQFTAVYAMRLKKRLDNGTLELNDLVTAAVKSHANGSLNPIAQHRKEVSPAEVLGSRMIADPLRLLMCSSLCDGAAAAIVTPSGYRDYSGRPEVRVRAASLRMGALRATEAEPSTSTLCAQDVYEASGIGPSDLDVLEVHDAMAPGEILYYEQLGLCEPLGGADHLRSGAPFLGGQQPVNPSGGLSSRGHPVGATGLAQIAEIAWQLRAEAGRRQVDGARLGLTQNSGGWLEGESAATAVHLFERISR